METETPKVRAKFRVHSIERNADGSGTVKLHPVYSGSPENESFFKFTPAGEITFYSVNGAAIDAFTAGTEFYVDFTPAPAG